jgi:uncharacterized protein YqgV (UPF0045/DUF77 family)
MRKHFYKFTAICPCGVEYTMSAMMTMVEAAEEFEDVLERGVHFICVERNGKVQTFWRDDKQFTFH